MFRDKIFESNRTLNLLMNAWNEVKVFAKVENGMLFARYLRGLNIDPRRAERNRELGRAYIQPIQCNR